MPGALWRFALRLRIDPALRDRTLGQAVFVGIFAFGLTSFDFLLTSGMDWSPDISAVASEPVHRVMARAGSAEVIDPAPVLAAAEVQPLDEMAAPNEDLLGGPDTILAAWSQPRPDEALLPVKPLIAVTDDATKLSARV